MRLKVIRETEDYIHLAIEGRLDAVGAESLESDFIAHTVGRRRHALVDASQVDFVASMGIRMLIRAAQGMGLAGAKLVLVHPQPLVLNALELAGVTRLVAVVPDALQAIARLANE